MWSQRRAAELIAVVCLSDEGGPASVASVPGQFGVDFNNAAHGVARHRATLHSPVDDCVARRGGELLGEY